MIYLTRQTRKNPNRIRRHGVDFNDEVVLKDPNILCMEKEFRTIFM